MEHVQPLQRLAFTTLSSFVRADRSATAFQTATVSSRLKRTEVARGSPCSAGAACRYQDDRLGLEAATSWQRAQSGIHGCHRVLTVQAVGSEFNERHELARRLVHWRTTIETAREAKHAQVDRKTHRAPQEVSNRWADPRKASISYSLNPRRPEDSQNRRGQPVRDVLWIDNSRPIGCHVGLGWFAMTP